jgi:hypothetical protein
MSNNRFGVNNAWAVTNPTGSNVLDCCLMQCNIDRLQCAMTGHTQGTIAN